MLVELADVPVADCAVGLVSLDSTCLMRLHTGERPHDRSHRVTSTRRDFLKASTAATAGLGFLPNAHAAGSDTIKVGLIGCGGRGTGAAENICEAAGTTYNIKIHAMADMFEDRLRNCRDAIRRTPSTARTSSTSPTSAASSASTPTRR